ncbi:response regulator [Cytophaga sp. FL35]|uniref:response regulator n=1 Tax=Cytophaga sp. FL35 TaxID=1904456 RepID=UPI001653CF7A|nr:response regulator [Cytophaga sp. FL35]MBC6997731.1 response regulator [Cytophaga sp. FL35]
MNEALKSICIIDDDAISVFGLKRALKKYDGETDPNPLVFENGQDAIDEFEELIEGNQPLPSVIFIDLNMPIMNGWEFVEEFKRIHPSEKTTPLILIMSSSIDPADAEKAKSYGLDDNYLSKPVSKEILEAYFN